MSKLLFVCVISAVFSIGFSNNCKNPEVTSKSFTTQDATIVTNIAFISEFKVNCKNGDVSNLYGDIGGNVVPVSLIESNKYEISWTEDAKTAVSGDKIVRIFDEDGYTALRKALRSGEDISSVNPLFNVVINYPGAYNGPWLKGELLATIISLVIAYFAVSFRSKINS